MMEKRHTVHIVKLSLAPAWQVTDKVSPPIVSQPRRVHIDCLLALASASREVRPAQHDLFCEDCPSDWAFVCVHEIWASYYVSALRELFITPRQLLSEASNSGLVRRSSNGSFETPSWHRC
ncbi:SRSF protein kinase 3 [Fusarium oxysporum f. sp. albedinis]|nr:SRSF protein kinase 3 [Fusarium oxysporum f. sp. albedinis]